MKDETIIISLGGSLIIPEELDVEFLKDFKKLIESQIALGKKFVVITGGGKICRKYQEAAQKVKEVSSDELDWLGIYSTRFNAEFVKILFGDLAEGEIILDPNLPVKLEKSIVVGGGWKPGRSTDDDAVILGKQLGVKKIINLSNIDYVYDSDPNKNPKAKKIEKIYWADYRALIPKDAKVVFHGGVSDEEYAKILANDAIMVSASRDEGFGLPLAEALGLGVPAVVSDLPIFHEVAGEGALYFKTNDPKDFADKILQLDDATIRKQLATIGKQHIASFNWENSAKTLLKVIQKI